MGSGDDRAYPRLVDGNRRKDDWLGEHPFVEEALAESAGGVGIAHHDRRDRRLRAADVEPEPSELRLEPARIPPEPLEQLRLLLHDPDRLATGLDDGRRMRR